MSRRPPKHHRPIAHLHRRVPFLYIFALWLSFCDAFPLVERLTIGGMNGASSLRRRPKDTAKFTPFNRSMYITPFLFSTPSLFRPSSLNLIANDSDEQEQRQRKRDKVMNFLRRMGRIGPTKDFTTAIGVDEGPAAKAPGTSVEKLNKISSSYLSCTVEQMIDGVVVGIIDDLTESFPRTSCGTEWLGFTDQVMGGVSIGKLTRIDNLAGRCANVMKGKVSLYNNGGFIQMACNLSRGESGISSTVDASAFQGIEMDLFNEGNEDLENFNVHLRNSACIRPFSAYRATIQLQNNAWQRVRVPFRDFVGYGPGASETPFDVRDLRRVGILAIGKVMDINLAVAGIRFYKNE